ncbi:MAG: helix-hairpin-helix domain-containing protein [Flavobacteriales bacterium]|nr:helix-hairpin-helix domain-containing protein [Flavobacteriales bacterium]
MNRRERTALLFFLLLLVFVNLIFRAFQKKAETVHYDNHEIQRSFGFVDSLNQSQKIYVHQQTSDVPKSNAPKIPFININSADSIALRKLPGIGVKYSSRMVRYRNMLGGFHTKEQLLEVYGIDSVLFDRILPYLLIGQQDLRKININTCTEKNLKAHPYISNPVAKLVVKYREHHGFYQSLDELKSLPLIDEQLFRKIVVYLEID